MPSSDCNQNFKASNAKVWLYIYPYKVKMHIYTTGSLYYSFNDEVAYVKLKLWVQEYSVNLQKTNVAEAALIFSLGGCLVIKYAMVFNCKHPTLYE